MGLNKLENMEIKILDKLSINQNVICWILSYIGIAYAAQYPNSEAMKCLCCFCQMLFLVFSLSVVSSMIVYSIEYWTKKWHKSKHPEL